MTMLTEIRTLSLLFSTFLSIVVEVMAEKCTKTVPDPNLQRVVLMTFECYSGCCGNKPNEFCCEKINPFWDKSLGYGVAFGGLFVVIVILVVIVSCCLYHRALRRKRSRLRELQQQRAGRRCSSVTVTQSLPPSYEMCLSGSTHTEPSRTSIPIDLCLPPSYEEVVSNVALSPPEYSSVLAPKLSNEPQEQTNSALHTIA